VTIRIELLVEDWQYEEAGVPEGALLAPVAVWFSGSNRNDIVVEFDVDEEGLET